MGAHLTKGESLMDPIWNTLRISISESFVMQPGIAAALALFSIIGLIFSLIFAKKAGLFDVKLAPETCQEFFKWDEPTIHTDQKKE